MDSSQNTQTLTLNCRVLGLRLRVQTTRVLCKIVRASGLGASGWGASSVFLTDFSGLFSSFSGTYEKLVRSFCLGIPSFGTSLNPNPFSDTVRDPQLEELALQCLT